MVYGLSTSTVSKKTNQVTIPKAMLRALGNDFVFLRLPRHPYAYLYGKVYFDRIVEIEFNGQTDMKKRLASSMTRVSQLISADTQGRVTLPRDFVTHVEGKENAVVFVADVHRIQLWTHAEYEKVKPEIANKDAEAFDLMEGWL
jgi:DNA-binding transcriptional regulator/RsmH inhibitor MraZ